MAGQKKETANDIAAEIEVKLLQDKVNNLEALVNRLAVMTGQGNLLPEFGLKRWEPGKKDMSKYD